MHYLWTFGNVVGVACIGEAYYVLFSCILCYDFVVTTCRWRKVHLMNCLNSPIGYVALYVFILCICVFV